MSRSKFCLIDFITAVVPLTKFYSNNRVVESEREANEWATRSRAPKNFFDGYQSISQIEAFIEGLARDNPSFVSVKSIGKSTEGRDLKVLVIGTNQQSNSKPCIWFDANIHAREWVAGTTGMFIADQLIEGYKRGDPTTKAIVNKFDWHMLPMANPDGYNYSKTKVSHIAILYFKK